MGACPLQVHSCVAEMDAPGSVRTTMPATGQAMWPPQTESMNTSPSLMQWPPLHDFQGYHEPGNLAYETPVLGKQRGSPQTYAMRVWAHLIGFSNGVSPELAALVLLFCVFMLAVQVSA